VEGRAWSALVPGHAAVHRGIAEFLGAHPHCTVTHRGHINDDTLDEARRGGLGLLATITSPTAADAVVAAGVPTVDMIGQHLREAVPTCTFDNHAIGVMAAEHFIERGFESLGFIGVGDRRFSLDRCQGFTDCAERADRTAKRLLIQPAFWKQSATGQHATLAEWLNTCPRPLGLMVMADWFAATVLEACNGAGIAVPHDVAVLGVDNDPNFAELTRPRLSSVEPDGRARGCRAAVMLDALMAGDGVVSEAIPPLHVVERESSDVTAIDDRDVAAACQFIRDHADAPISVDDVVAPLNVSRRTMEQRFKRATGQTISQAIWSTHMDLARRLLRETDLSLLDVALRSGFASHSSFSTIFRKHEGASPRAYRRRFGT